MKDKVDELVKIFNGDLDLMLFYVTWIKNGLNSTKAYKELHPAVTNGSAEVLGSRLLGKVSKESVMQAYGLNQETYFNQLKEAMSATKWNDFTGEREADHTTRKGYHDKLGKLLGIEVDAPHVLQQYNVGGEMTLEFIGDESKTTQNSVGSSK